MDLLTIDYIYQALQRLRDGAHMSVTYGLCFRMELVFTHDLNKGQLIPEMKRWLTRSFPAFDKYTGDHCYPVPHPDKSPKGAFNTCNLWEDDEYGRNRKMLLKTLTSMALEQATDEYLGTDKIKKYMTYALKEIVAGRIPDTSSGICWNVYKEFYMVDYMFSRAKVQKWMESVFVQWPEYSGNKEYPVPAPNITLPDSNFSDPAAIAYWAFEGTKNRELWEGEYGESRKRLAKFLLDNVESLQCPK